MATVHTAPSTPIIRFETAPVDRPATDSPAASGEMSPAGRGLVTFVAAVTLVVTAATALIYYATDVPLIGAFGAGLYLAFWVGGGFGLIFGSAAALSGDH